MRKSVAIAFVLACALVGNTAWAKAWFGMKPGVATRNTVVKKFGSPDHEEGPSARYHKRIVYNGESVRDTYGAAEAQFWFDKNDRLQEIYVIPAVELSRADVEHAWGKNFKEYRTDDFRLYIHYPADGFVVFFERGVDRVYQLVYTQPKVGKNKEDKPDNQTAEPKKKEDGAKKADASAP